MPEVLIVEPAPVSGDLSFQPAADCSIPVVPNLQSLFRELEPTEAAHSAPLTTPISQCFHWSNVLAKLLGLEDFEASQVADYLPHNRSNILRHFVNATRFYVVVFRSVRGVNADDQLLYKADAEAQVEARASGGLLKYWYGTLNERRECLAMCIWDSQESAKAALHQEKHRIAMQLTSKMYDMYNLERYWLTVLGSPVLEGTPCHMVTGVTNLATTKKVDTTSELSFAFMLIRPSPAAFNPSAPLSLNESLPNVEL